MLRLVPLAGPLKGRRIDVEHGSTIGRDEGCAVRLVHRSVSRSHARVERTGEGWWIVDAGSRNGVLVDRERRDRIPAEHGLVVRFGEYPVRLELATEPVAAAEVAETADVLEEELDFLEEGEAGDVGLALEDPADIELAEGARPVPSAPETEPEPAPTAPALRELERAELLAGLERDRSGLLRGDLTQQPGWIQAAVWLGVLGVGGAIAWAVAKVITGTAG